MRHLFAIAAAVAVTGLLAAETARAQFTPYAKSNAAANNAAAKPSVNNNAAQPNTNNNSGNFAPASRTQRPWAYSNPKYYNRPWSYSDPKYYPRPSPQYYPTPTPYYTNRPYYPYDSVDQGYGYYVVPWGAQPRYVPPRFYYQPYYQTNPYYNQMNPYFR